MPTACKHVQSSIPEMDEVTPERKQLIDEFLLRLRQKCVPLPPPWVALNEPEVEVLAYKYLTARKWNVEDALFMATDTIEWRQKNGMNGVNPFPSVFPIRGYDTEDLVRTLHLSDVPLRPHGRLDTIYKAISPHYFCNYHYWDKEGHPVIYELLARTEIKPLFEAYRRVCKVGLKPVSVALEYHMYQNEMAGQLIRFRDAKNQEEGKRRIRGFTAVIDATGLGLHLLSSSAIDLLKECFAVDSAHYPEVLHRVFIINCPSLITFAYSLLKGSLDQRVQNKITFCTVDETFETLRVVIDEDKIPRCFGGSCTRCQDGVCLDTPGRAADPAQSRKSSDDLASRNDSSSSKAFVCDEESALTEELKVPAGEKIFKEYQLVGGETLAWELFSTTGYDVTVSATFKATGTESSELVVQPIKTTSHSHSFVAPSCGGLLTVTLDNGHSWLKTKKIQFRACSSMPEKSCGSYNNTQ